MCKGIDSLYIEERTSRVSTHEKKGIYNRGKKKKRIKIVWMEAACNLYIEYDSKSLSSIFIFFCFFFSISPI